MPGKGSSAGRVTPPKGQTQRTQASSSGRITPKSASPAAPSGRYTPPIPRAKKVSPPWYPWVLVGLFVVGLAVIVANYASIFWTATNWALVGGMAAILAGTLMATRYR